MLIDLALPAANDLLILSAAEVRDCLDLAELRLRLQRAFVLYSDGVTSVPPRVSATTALGLVGAMPGYVPDVGLEVKVVTVFPGNHGTALPSHQALIALFDDTNGAPLAVMDGTYITQIRTAASAAIAADLCAAPTATTLAIVGAGAQGQAHLLAFADLRPWTDIRVFSRNTDAALELAARHPAAHVVADIETAVRGADVVCLCTDAAEPIIEYDWLSPGAHVSSVGMGHEVDPATVAAARVVVEWRGAVTSPPMAGAVELQGLDPATVTELGELLAGFVALHDHADGITLYKSTGLAIEDAAAARLVYDTAIHRGVGTHVQV